MRLYDQKNLRDCHTSNCCPVLDREEGGVLLFHDPDEVWRGSVRLLPGEVDAILEYAVRLSLVPPEEQNVLYETSRLSVTGHRDGTVIVMVLAPFGSERYTLTREQWNLFLEEAPKQLPALAA